MSFNGRREYLFVYTVKDANPNGDPLDANSPRRDEETGQIMVSDVRVKRTVRDQWIREGKEVFVDGETKTLNTRVDEIKKSFSVSTGREALANCIDTRLFGVTFALGKESFSWTGPVQFKWGRSLHRAEPKLVQGTAAFTTGEGKEQRSFRNEYIVPFVVIADYGIANQYASSQTGATDDDLDCLRESLWKGTINLITRSKVGHCPRFLLEVSYMDGFDGAVGSMDEKVELKNPDGSPMSEDQQLALRAPDSCSMDISRLVGKLVAREKDVRKIRVITDKEIPVVGLDELCDTFGERIVIETR
nr:type I-B CRISPR-associated protein Cas7/Csh2 [uncultured Dethiosulfovibrio sp.]